MCERAADGVGAANYGRERRGRDAGMPLDEPMRGAPMRHEPPSPRHGRDRSVGWMRAVRRAPSPRALAEPIS